MGLKLQSNFLNERYMNTNTNTQDAEINIIDLINFLLSKKRSFIFIFLASIIFGSVNGIFNKSPYTAKIIISSNHLHPLEDQFIKDISRYTSIFFSENNFSDWKKINPKAALELNDIQNYFLVDGQRFLLEESKRKTVISKVNDSNEATINFKFNIRPKISEAFEYSKYTNGILTNQISEMYKDRLTLIKDSKEALLVNNSTLLRETLKNLKNRDILAVDFPSPPKLEKSFPKIFIIFSSLIFILGTLLLLAQYFFIKFKFIFNRESRS